MVLSIWWTETVKILRHCEEATQRTAPILVFALGARECGYVATMGWLTYQYFWLSVVTKLPSSKMFEIGLSKMGRAPNPLISTPWKSAK